MAPFFTAPFADNVQCLPTNVKKFLGVTGRRTRVTRDAARIATWRGGKSAACYSFGRGWAGGELGHDGVTGTLACVLECVASGPASAGGGSRHDQAAVGADAAGSAVVVAVTAQERAVDDPVEIGAELHDNGVVAGALGGLPGVLRDGEIRRAGLPEEDEIALGINAYAIRIVGIGSAEQRAGQQRAGGRELDDAPIDLAAGGPLNRPRREIYVQSNLHGIVSVGAPTAFFVFAASSPHPRRGCPTEWRLEPGLGFR